MNTVPAPRAMPPGARTALPYVQAQLGHASISMTVDTYGRWLPTGNRTLIDQIDGNQPPETADRAVAAASG